jgi:hypothetical protein
LASLPNALRTTITTATAAATAASTSTAFAKEVGELIVGTRSAFGEAH